MEVTHAFTGLAVGDLEAAVAWYERLLGRPPDRRPIDGEAMWRLGADASLFLRADPARAGRGLAALAVADLAVVPGERHGTPPRVLVRDPDGNELTVFEDPAGAPVRDFHLVVKERELELEAAETIRVLQAAFASLPAAAADARDLLERALPPGAAGPEWGMLDELVESLRVALRLVHSQLDRAQADALAEAVEALDVVRRRRQNLGRGGNWVEG